MKNTEYTFAVARIRANEARLLSAQELEALISAADFSQAAHRLSDKGYSIEGNDFSAALNNRLSDCWQLISSVLPDKTQFDSLIIKNDYANLKVMLKARVSGKSTNGLFASPSVYSAEELEKCINEDRFDKLPEAMQMPVTAAYDALTQLGFAQAADSVLDKAALKAAIELAKKADNPIMAQIAETNAVLCNLKMLYRGILTGKDSTYYNRSLVKCSAFSRSDIVKAVLSGGMDAFCEFISHTSYSGAAEAVKQGGVAFEKWCDNRLTDVLRAAKTETFGIAPLAAYWLSVNTEVMNIRIILSAKLNGLQEDAIRERVREAYV